MDKRKNNGGNSTKSSGVDKRKNKYTQLLDEASTEDDVIKVIQNLKSIAMKSDDIQAIKLFLEYYLGKPKETIENNLKLLNFDIRDVIRFKTDDSTK